MVLGGVFFANSYKKGLSGEAREQSRENKEKGKRTGTAAAADKTLTGNHRKTPQGQKVPHLNPRHREPWA